MRRGERLKRPRQVLTWLLSCAAISLSSGIVLAADNTATGDVAGVATDLTDSNTITLTSTTLGLVKAAFLTATGTALPTGTSVPKGTLVDFLIYVDNDTPVPVPNLNVSDPLVGFTYQAGTIRVDNSEDTGATAAAIYAAAKLATPLDDGVDGTDTAGILGSTISAGAGTGNLQLDIISDKVWALLFTASVD